MTPRTFEGGCHCGNLTYAFEASALLEELGLRACQCSYCRKHGGRNTSDPNGRMRVFVKEPAKLKRYRFGLKTADFLTCTECGVYIGALMQEGDASWMTVNVNTFAAPPLDNHPVAPMDFDSESEAGRLARRRARWTPVVEFREGTRS